MKKILALILVLSLLAVPVSAAADAMLGDLDGNGRVNTDDVVALLLYLTMPDVFPLEGVTDFNNDIAVTAEDAVALLLYVSMPDQFPLEPPHTHIYSSSVTTPATCTEDGVQTFTCECGHSYTEAIPAEGHTWGEWVVVEPADAYHQGVSQRTCGICSATEDKSLPIVKSLESSLDTSLNLTGTEYEAFIRQYACDNAPDNYGDGMDGTYFYFENLPNNDVLNFLSLTNAKTYFNVGHRKGQAGALYSSFLEGTSSYINPGTKDMIQETIAETVAMLNRPVDGIDVDVYPTGGGGDLETLTYKTVSEIPEDIWEKLALGHARFSVYFAFPYSNVSAGLSIVGDQVMFGIYYFEALNSNLEYHVDPNINLTNTEFEAAVRRYTRTHIYTRYSKGEFSNRFIFEINNQNCADTNVLSLEDLYGYIYVKHNPGQLGTLYTAEYRGYISCIDIREEDAIRQTLADISTAFGPQKGRLGIEVFDSGWTYYTSVSEIPSEMLLKVACGEAMIHVDHGNSNLFSFTLYGGNYRLSVRYHVYFSTPDGI